MILRRKDNQLQELTGKLKTEKCLKPVKKPLYLPYVSCKEALVVLFGTLEKVSWFCKPMESFPTMGCFFFGIFDSEK